MSNRILNTMAVFTESFEHIDISEDELLEVASKINFIHLFSDVKDFRQKGKIKYKLSNILFLIFLVKLTERTNSFVEIAAYIKIRKNIYTNYGLIENDQCPSHDTIRRIMSLLDHETLYNETIGRFYEFLLTLEKEIQGTKHKHLAMDGKSVNGSGRSEETLHPMANQQLLNIYDCGLATCIFCEPVDAKTNEIPVGQDLLKTMELKKTVVTADALHCQRDTARIIAERRGIYVLTVKENQALLLQEISARMEKYSKKVTVHQRENRRIEILLLPASYADDGFKGLKAFVKMISNTGKKQSIRHFISNTKDQELICEAIEARWSIENHLHKEKDTFFYEDRITYTNKNAVRNMAIFNNLAVQLVKIFQATVEPDFYFAKRTLHAFPIESIQQILGIINSDSIIKRFKSNIKKSK